MAPDGTLLVVSSGVTLVSPDDAEPLGHLKDGGENLHAARISGDTLHLITEKGARTLRLSPSAWHATLCGALDGPNSRTRRGRPVLDLAKDTPPCPST
ncbi:hypothetical protein [Streptomyces afghaniensis]|uniref:hypothetical protein n=1 Tax=Streptomyces afghaniensis TaxID=66865 RepID=UPI0027817486|nr:hypothetical protein [Streptomyces afghaniensis]MDQ1015594.1 hypothetical protein [Streptomyces afghaniensis]